MFRWGLVTVALLLAPAAGANAQRADTPSTCTVAYVVDGDTFNCRGGTVVRLLLVDAPEGGRFGDASRRALSTLLPVDTTVRLQTDREVRGDDGRVRAYVHLENGSLVNYVMIRKGFAFFKPNPPNQLHAERLRAAEEAARAEGLGVWAR